MHAISHLWQRPLGRYVVTALLLLVLGTGAVGTGKLHLDLQPAAHAAGSTCQLNSANGAIQHVIYIQFDNTHFTRDNPNVPSDLEQTPN